MSYKQEHYNEIFRAMRFRFGEKWYVAIAPTWWNVWRHQIKAWLFDKGILISEIVAALDEAAGKRRWPMGVSFFKRVQDVVFKNRREQAHPVRISGLQPIGSVIRGVVDNRT